jgi:FdhD protein
LVTENRKIVSISLAPDHKSEEIMDELALDEPTCIFVNGEYLVTLIASPLMNKELAVGHLLSESIIPDIKEIKSIEFRENDVHVELEKEVDLREASVGMMNLIVTACSASPRARKQKFTVPKVKSTLKIAPTSIVEMIRELNKRSNVHLRTRGTHAAMACKASGEVQAFAEDVGRHNAMDKVIGSLALNKIDPGKCILLSTGRQSGEMVQKAARAGIPIIASMTVPLISGVRLAEASGITLASVDKGRVKVYTHPNRIK